MIADIGYGLAGLSYLILLLLLFTVKKAGLAKYLLILATIATLLWSAAHITVLSSELTLNRLLFIDTGKQVVWLLFLAAFLRDDFRSIWDVLGRPVTLAILALPLAALTLPLVIPLTPTWRFLLQTMIALEVLVLLEQVYRQSGEQRWTFKPLVLYLGALNLFEFVTYANATMVAQVEPLYIAARGYIYMALVPLLIIATRRIKHWGIDIFISREVVLHSSLLLVAGAYLLLMASLGYAVNYFGGNWGATIQVVLIALSVALLATVFLSDSFRNRLKVFIAKNFFANQFDYRIEWVKLTQALSAECQSLSNVYDAALTGYLGAIKYSNGALLKRNHTAFETVANSQLRIDFSPALQVKLMQFFMRTQWIFDCEEYRLKPYTYEGLKLSTEEQDQLDQMIVVPIGEGESLWGVVALHCDSNNILRLNWELRDYLNAATAQISNFILHNEAATQVAENAQFAAFSRMSAFVVHDLKNVLAQIDLILCNAQQHKNNPEFIDDTFETLEHTKSRMDKMLSQLSEKQPTESINNGSHLLSEIVAEVMRARCANLLPVPKLTVDSEKPVVVDPEKFANVMYHLISNAQQATADSGYVELNLAHAPAMHLQTLVIKDNGEGMSESFIRERLFKPFETTKGNAGMGIGAYDARNYLDSIGGSLTVESAVGSGTVFTLSVPTN